MYYPCCLRAGSHACNVIVLRCHHLKTNAPQTQVTKNLVDANLQKTSVRRSGLLHSHEQHDAHEQCDVAQGQQRPVEEKEDAEAPHERSTRARRSVSAGSSRKNEYVCHSESCCHSPPEWAIPHKRCEHSSQVFPEPAPNRRVSWISKSRGRCRRGPPLAFLSRAKQPGRESQAHALGSPREPKARWSPPPPCGRPPPPPGRGLGSGAWRRRRLRSGRCLSRAELTELAELAELAG